MSPATGGGAKIRRTCGKLLKRQSRVGEDREVRRLASEPAPLHSAAHSALRKHDSYPQYAPYKGRRPKSQESEPTSVLIRAVSLSVDGEAIISGARASHTPAVRAGPPLSCNFCWNTVDECGRILRRKTQFHCPECRTNLCIVPCFHKYHDAEGDIPIPAAPSMPPAPAAPASAPASAVPPAPR